MKRIEGSDLRLGATALTFLLACSAAQASVNISSAATKHMRCSAGVCSPTAKRAVLNVNDLASMLQTSDVKVATGSGAVAIEITAPLSWASTKRLTLDANLNVSVKAPVTVAGAGAVTITTSDGGTGGDLLFFPGAKVDFWDLGSGLTINDISYSLVSNITTLADDVTTDPSGSYALANDYDASLDGTYKTSPVETAFDGKFEGLGHAVANLAIKHGHGKCVGLLSAISSSGIARDLNLTKSKISLTYHSAVGALVGCNSGLVVHDSVGGNIHGATGNGQRAYIGGLVGWNTYTGIIADVSSEATVNGDSYDNMGSFVGGLVGRNDGTIVSSHATGTVVGARGSYVGGLVGNAVGSGGSIFQSYASGSVSTGDGGVAGGLAGWGNHISQSYATGPVQGSNGVFVGGLAGEGTHISQSYATGSVQQTGTQSAVGGLVGYGDTISESYSIGPVSGGSDSQVGGFMGGVDVIGSLSSGYWDIETSGTSQGCGISDCSGVTGLTTAQFQSGLPAGFDPAVWGEDPNINSGFPYLLALPPAE